MNCSNFLHFNISRGSYSDFLEKIVTMAKSRRYSRICVANVHMFIEAYKNEKFLNIINTSDIVTPDGRPLIWGLELLKGIDQERVAGMDLLPDLLTIMEKESISAYFYGGTTEMLEKTGKYLRKNFPRLSVAGYHSPPFNDLENPIPETVVSEINTRVPSIVFVILGCPKQEKWMASMEGILNTVLIGIGGSLPVMIGMQKRAPKWMQDRGLEWLFRLAQEPKRLYKRYTITNSLFLWIFIKEYLRLKVLAPLKRNFSLKSHEI